MINKNKKLKASILAVTMIILGIVLVSALSISMASIKERKASLGSNSSGLAYQAANTGVETIMKAIISAGQIDQNTKVKDLSIPNVSCVNNVLVGQDFTVELKDNSGDRVDCGNGAGRVSDVTSIKSIGTIAGKDQRAIEAAVAQSAETASVGSRIHVNPVSGQGITNLGWSLGGNSRSTFLINHNGGWGQSAEDGGILVLDIDGNVMLKLMEGRAIVGDVTVKNQSGSTIATFPNQAQAVHNVIVLLKNIPSFSKVRSDGAGGNPDNPTTFKKMDLTYLGDGAVDYSPSLAGSDKYYEVTFN